MLDALDQSQITLLRMDARLPVARLSASLGLTRVTVRARPKQLTKEGVVVGFTVVHGTETETTSIRTVTMIKVDGHHAESVIRCLSGLPEIRRLHTTSGR